MPRLTTARPPRPTAARHARLGLAAALLLAPLAAPRGARAQLLIDAAPAGAPGSGTTTDIARLMADRDDGVVVRPFADAFTFYGVPRTAVAVTSNGYVHFDGDASWARGADRGVGELADELGGAAAAVLYDDLVLDDRSTLLEHVAPGRYQAYTFADVLGYGDGQGGTQQRSTFQVAFFTGATRIGGIDFLAGDVAYSYGALAHAITERSATVGVARDAEHYTALPGSAEGEITDFAALPGGAPGAAAFGQRLVLLRPNAAGGYDLRNLNTRDPRAQVTVPEPSSVALVAAGLGAAWAARRRRRA